ncbi:MAG: hypothetical protein IPJ10_13890 [Flavobacteriales bacterium]|nr:hypothetical protein [Flavobacteriales bacterium]
MVTIFVGGKKLLDGDPSVTVGNIAEFVIYVNMLTWPFASVGWVTSLVQQASASMERINEFLDARPAVTDADVPRHRPKIQHRSAVASPSGMFPTSTPILGSAHWIVFPSKFQRAAPWP